MGFQTVHLPVGTPGGAKYRYFLNQQVNARKRQSKLGCLATSQLIDLLIVNLGLAAKGSVIQNRY